MCISYLANNPHTEFYHVFQKYIHKPGKEGKSFSHYTNYTTGYES